LNPLTKTETPCHCTFQRMSARLPHAHNRSETRTTRVTTFENHSGCARRQMVSLGL